MVTKMELEKKIRVLEVRIGNINFVLMLQTILFTVVLVLLYAR